MPGADGFAEFQVPRHFIFLLALLFAWSAPAAAQEVFVGLHQNGVNTPLSLEAAEGGAQIQAGYRFKPARALKAIGSPQPYVIVSVNTRGDTSFAGAGLSWKLGPGKVYVRPGLGIVVRDGPSVKNNYTLLMRTDMGSRVLFEPEIALGVQVSERVSVEASWTHISHAKLAHRTQNPGLDQIGVRVNFRLGRR